MRTSNRTLTRLTMVFVIAASWITSQPSPAGATTCGPQDYAVWIDLSADGKVQVEEYVCVPQHRDFGPAGSFTELLRTNGFDRRDADVLRLYEVFFNRQADLDGAKYWLTVADDMRTQSNNPALIITGFFAESDEFEHMYEGHSDAEFVDNIYRNALDRSPDSEGIAYWIGLLQGGALSRGQLVFYFSQSTEFRLNHLYQPLWQLEVTPRYLESGELIPAGDWLPDGI